MNRREFLKSAAVLTALAAAGKAVPAEAEVWTPEKLRREGRTLQELIDACPPGGVVRLGEGVFTDEMITLDHPVILHGAGADKTYVGYCYFELPPYQECGARFDWTMITLGGETPDTGMTFEGNHLHYRSPT